MIQKGLLVFGALGLACAMADAECPAGFQNVVGPMVNPNGQPLAGGRIVVSLGAPSAVNGIAVAANRLPLQVVAGVLTDPAGPSGLVCLAPGGYTVSVYPNGPNSTPSNSVVWRIPASGGPYTVPQIQGSFIAPTAPVAAGQILPGNDGEVLQTAGGSAKWGPLTVSGMNGQLLVNSSGRVSGAVDATYDPTTGVYLFGTLDPGVTLTNTGKQYIFATATGLPTHNLNATIVQQNSNNTTTPGNSAFLVRAGSFTWQTLPTDLTNYTSTLEGGTGLIGTASHRGQGTMGVLTGLSGRLIVGLTNSAVGAVNDAAAVRAVPTFVSNAANIQTLAAFRAHSATPTTGTVVNSYGMLIDPIQVGTNKWGIYMSDLAYLGGGVTSVGPVNLSGMTWDGSRLVLGSGNQIGVSPISGTIFQPSIATAGTIRVYPGVGGVSPQTNLSLYSTSDISDVNSSRMRFISRPERFEMLLLRAGTGVIPPVMQIGSSSTDTTGALLSLDFQFGGVTKAQVLQSGLFSGTLFTPASSSDVCSAGTFADDASYHYVCVAASTWKRAALSSF